MLQPTSGSQTFFLLHDPSGFTVKIYFPTQSTETNNTSSSTIHHLLVQFSAMTQEHYILAPHLGKGTLLEKPTQQQKSFLECF